MALLARDYPARPGGIQTYTHALATHLMRLGVKMDVFVGWTDAGTLLAPTRVDPTKYDVVHV